MLKICIGSWRQFLIIISRFSFTHPFQMSRKRPPTEKSEDEVAVKLQKSTEGTPKTPKTPEKSSTCWCCEEYTGRVRDHLPGRGSIMPCTKYSSFYDPTTGLSKYWRAMEKPLNRRGITTWQGIFGAGKPIEPEM